MLSEIEKRSIKLAESEKELDRRKKKIEDTIKYTFKNDHITVQNILNELNFKPNHTIEEAITELKNALEKNILKNTLENEFYFNIKRMKNLKLN